MSNDIGSKIQEHRQKQGMTQEVLADELGVSRQSVSKWETGQALPEVDKITVMSRLFGIPTDELLCVGGDAKEEGNQVNVNFVTNVFCNSCAMFMTEEKFGTMADGTKTSEYCHYCYNKGNFTTNQTLDEAVESNIPFWLEQCGNCEDAARKRIREVFTTLNRWK